MTDLIIRPKMPPTCGACHFGKIVPQDLNVVSCRGLPPTPVCVGATVQGPQIIFMWPNLKRDEEGCALFKARTSVTGDPGLADVAMEGRA